MKTKTIRKIVEGSFLFTLIVLMFMLSIFSAKGQMSIAATQELGLTSLSFKDTFYVSTNPLEKLLIPKNEYIDLKSLVFVEKNSRVDFSKLEFPNLDLRKRRRSRNNPWHAPKLIIPIQ